MWAGKCCCASTRVLPATSAGAELARCVETDRPTERTSERASSGSRREKKKPKSRAADGRAERAHFHPVFRLGDGAGSGPGARPHKNEKALSPDGAKT